MIIVKARAYWLARRHELTFSSPSVQLTYSGPTSTHTCRKQTILHMILVSHVKRGMWQQEEMVNPDIEEMDETRSVNTGLQVVG